MSIVCQCCGKAIEPTEKAILISYGYIAKSGKFYNQNGVDYFHIFCDVAIRQSSKR